MYSKEKKTVGTFEHKEENFDYSEKMEESSFPLGGTHLQTETREEEYLLAEKKIYCDINQSFKNGKSKTNSSDATCNITSMNHLNILINVAEDSTNANSNIGTNMNKIKSESIKGTTFIFIPDSESSNISFKKIKISSERISTSIHRNVAAIQTQQYQKTSWKLRGHACMINQNGIWKLVFIHDASTIYHGELSGYMYNGHVVGSKDLISCSISAKDKTFYWVNLLPEKFPSNSLPDLKYPISVRDGYYYGNHSPSHIELPKLTSENVQTLGLDEKLIKLRKTEKESSTETMKETKINGVYMKTSLESNKRTQTSHKPKQGRGRKTIPIFRTKQTDGLHYLTIFQPDNYDVQYRKYLDSSMLYIAVPYKDEGKKIANHPFRTVHYTLIHYSNIQQLQNTSIMEYNETLDTIGVLKFPLYQPTIDTPTRFCIVSKQEFEEMIAHPKLYSWEAVKTIDSEKKNHSCELKLVDGVNGSTQFLYGITDIPNVLLPGICVSMWKNSPKIQDVTMEFVNTIEKSFGRGFGDRSCAPCLGVNTYFGNHYNKRVIDRPETQPGTRFHDHYGRQTDKYQQMIPLCQKFIYAQARRVREEAQTMNKNYMLFVGYDTCNRIIWTQGIDHPGKFISNNDGHQNQRCISFANKLHIDKCDVIKQETTEKWFEWLEMLKRTKCEDEETKQAANYVIGKFRDLGKTFGIGLPTTCGYSHVTTNKSSIIEINSSFIQMNFAMKISNKSMHHMYAWAFPHATALAIAVTSGSKILVHNEKSQAFSVNVAAWGNSGGFKHAEKRNL